MNKKYTGEIYDDIIALDMNKEQLKRLRDFIEELLISKECPKAYQGVGDDTCWKCKLSLSNKCPYNKRSKK